MVTMHTLIVGQFSTRHSLIGRVETVANSERKVEYPIISREHEQVGFYYQNNEARPAITINPHESRQFFSDTDGGSFFATLYCNRRDPSYSCVLNESNHSL